MNILTQIEDWGNSHRIAALDYVRIVIGLFITYKGIMFIANIDDLQALTGNMDLMFASAALAHYVVFFHVLGGPLIALGLYTRFISLLQLPVLLGAVFVVNYPQGFLATGGNMEFEISIAVQNEFVGS